MTFEQFAEIVRDWQNRHTPAQVHMAVETLLPMRVVDDLPNDTTVEAALAMVAKSAPAPCNENATKSSEATADLMAPGHEVAPTVAAGEAKDPKRASEPPVPTMRGRPSARARALVREQLKHGPRLEASVLAAAQAAAIPERALIAAASVLGVRTRKGQWWLPGRAA